MLQLLLPVPKPVWIAKHRPINALLLLGSQLYLSYLFSHQITLATWFWSMGITAITIGGYVQNYFDDHLHPDSRSYAFLWFIAGLASLLMTSLLTNQWLFLGSGVLAIMLLKMYSPVLKRFGFVGNLSVAILTAWSFIGLALSLILTNDQHSFEALIWLSYFAFLTTLSREIIKDIEDTQEDLVLQRKTLPILIGQKFTFIAHAVLAILVGFKLLQITLYQTDLLFYLMLTLTICWLVSIWYFYGKPNKAHQYQLIIKFFQAIMIICWPFISLST